MSEQNIAGEIIKALRTLRCADPCNCLSCPCEQFRSYATDEACDDGTRLAGADIIEFQQSRIVELEQQLSERQKRERAAVEDLRRFPGITPCYVCKYYRGRGKPVSEHCSLSDRSCFEWRGPQEAWKGIEE